MPGLSEASSAFLRFVEEERKRARNTVAAYRRDLAAYERFLAAAGRTVADATDEHVSAHLRRLESEGRKPSSVARALVAIRSLHRFLGTAAAEAVTATPVVPTPPDALDDGEIARLLAAVPGSDPVARRDRALLHVLCGTGVRISELVGLDVPDVDLGRGRLTVRGPTGRDRAVPLAPAVAAALAAWLAPGGRNAVLPARPGPAGDGRAVFLNSRGGRLSRQGAWGIVRRWGEAAGLGERLTPQVLRHSFASRLLAGGADPRAVQELLGQASLSRTSRQVAG